LEERDGQCYVSALFLKVALFCAESQAFSLLLIGKALRVIEFCTCGLESKGRVEVLMRFLVLILAHMNVASIEEVFRCLTVQLDGFLVVVKRILQLLRVVVSQALIIVVATQLCGAFGAALLDVTLLELDCLVVARDRLVPLVVLEIA
jgi:hypothetical protein